ncbi:MAG: SDR family NAD(P)-dependent oxidoreductase [Devosia sp.]|nr:SDR family NAD(P)-dependent oxidoreductase [Devosia sp.]
MNTDFDGRTCLIFGASSGIGAAVARRFGVLGVRLVIHCNTNRDGAEQVAADIRTAGGKVEIVQGDLARPGVAANLVDDALAQLGSLDIVINNAGTMFGRTEIADATDEQYRQVIDLNIGGVFFASRRAAEIMRQRRRGTIISTTSVAARSGGGGGAGLYGSAKAFVSTLTRVLAKELAPAGVRVNAVAPGVIATPFHERYSTPEQLETSLRSIPLGRLGTAEDCVGAYEFLANERMSGYVTGQIIEVNGGQLMP